MGINRKLLPVKTHFFFFMASMGPVLPQLPVYGKELGISSVVMGSVTGLLPFTFLLTKPIFGLLVDIYCNYRKPIFMVMIASMTLAYTAMYAVPFRTMKQLTITNLTINISSCTEEDFHKELECTSTTPIVCNSSCLTASSHFLSSNETLCSIGKNLSLSKDCTLVCEEDAEEDNSCFYKSTNFWSFIVLMCVGTIGFNVINSISDAICFDVVGNEHDYGKQRVWGTIGFGVTALLSGYLEDFFFTTRTMYIPALTIMLLCAIADLLACRKLELPIISAPNNIFRDLWTILGNIYVSTFILFTVMAGLIDSLITYFLFWYVEDLAKATDTKNIKLIEGLIVAAETLGGEIVFFPLSGLILERLGHVSCFTLCFINYALRLGLISLAPSPWWIIPIEFMQGPTYALMYATIVAYANKCAPPGTSATMQGIAAGMGAGYGIGSLVGGLSYQNLGGSGTFQAFAGLSLICGLVHFALHAAILRRSHQYESLY